MSSTAVEAPRPSALPDRTYDARQLAEVLGVRYTTILDWARSGIIPAGRRFGRRTLRWTAADIAPMLADRR